MIKKCKIEIIGCFLQLLKILPWKKKGLAVLVSEAQTARACPAGWFLCDPPPTIPPPQSRLLLGVWVASYIHLHQKKKEKKFEFAIVRDEEFQQSGSEKRGGNNGGPSHYLPWHWEGVRRESEGCGGSDTFILALEAPPSRPERSNGLTSSENQRDGGKGVRGGALVSEGCVWGK